jgi:hypothetical protein
MPHLRHRHITSAFEKLCAHSRIVGILGHRQVGKTTFLEANTKEYFTLDDQTVYREVKIDPQGFIARLAGNRSGIDECQLIPSLFPALKLRVQKNHKPGQFVLSGSVRFTSRKAIRESLTGRISNLEMFPMVLTELDSEPLSDFFPKLLSCQNLESFLNQRRVPGSVMSQRRKTVQKYLLQGGLPGVCFIRESATRNRIVRDLIMTILDRDLRLVYPTSTPYSQIFELCQIIAQSSLSVIRWSELHRRTGLAEKTLRNLIHALEAVFLLRPIPVEGGGARGAIYFFEDQLEEFFFGQQKQEGVSAWTGLVYRNSRAQFEYQLGFTPQYFHYLTRAKSMVPLGIRCGAEVLGIFPVDSKSELGRAQMAAAGSFLKQYEHSKVIFLGFHGFEADVIDARTAVVPVEMALY